MMNGILIGFVLMGIAGLIPAGDDAGMRIVHAARAQIGKTLRYDPAYRSLAYPNGDIPMDRGVCTDVVVRALRSGLGLDLQRLVHEDIRRAFGHYARDARLKTPDRNIDHRRVVNLKIFFRRKGWSIPVSAQAEDYRPGDLVACTVPPAMPHIMIVSDKKSITGRPLVIHNIGAGAREEDRLFEFPLTGHYRIPDIEPAGGAPVGRRES